MQSKHPNNLENLRAGKWNFVLWISITISGESIDFEYIQDKCGVLIIITIISTCESDQLVCNLEKKSKLVAASNPLFERMSDKLTRMRIR